MSCGHGGQIVLSSSVAALRGTDGLKDLGVHRLKDLGAPERLWQVGEADWGALRTLDRAQHNLPVMRTPLLGREQDLEEVVGHLSERALVSLTGIGGTGKTRLALAAAATVTDDFPDGVWFVDLVPVSNPDDLPGAVARAAGLELGSGGALDSLVELLVGRAALFVLDNCEHLTDAVADLVDAILDRTDDPTLLATSREPLGLPDEQQVDLDPLAADSEASPAVELFVATASRAGVEVGEGDRPAIVEICQRLDGLPLAVELAAGQLRHLSLVDLGDRLDQR